MADSLNDSFMSIEDCRRFFAPTQPALICFTLSCFVFEVQKKLALQSAYHSLIHEKELSRERVDSFIEVALQSIERQTMMEIAMMFDRAHFRENDSCSFELLKEKIGSEECTEYFSRKQFNEVIKQIDNLSEKYAETLSKEIRNKQMAHHDLSKLQEFHESQVNLSDLIDLMNESANLISEIGTILCGRGFGEVIVPQFSDLESH